MEKKSRNSKMQILICVIIGLIVFFIYSNYQTEQRTTDTPEIINPKQENNFEILRDDSKDEEEYYTSEDETEFSEEKHAGSELKVRKVFKECPMCYRTYRCSVCGGGGIRYLFGEWKDCPQCGGSGACGFCQGNGFIETEEYYF